jgi:hypothetical protein
LKLVFAEPKTAFIDMGKPDWTPYTRPQTIECMIQTPRTEYNGKRNKIIENDKSKTPRHMNRTFASVTSCITTSTVAIQGTQTINPPPSISIQPVVSISEFEGFKQLRKDGILVVKQLIVQNMETTNSNIQATLQNLQLDLVQQIATIRDAI